MHHASLPIMDTQLSGDEHIDYEIHNSTVTYQKRLEKHPYELAFKFTTRSYVKCLKR